MQTSAANPTTRGATPARRPRGRTLGTKTLTGLGLSFGIWCALLYQANASLLRPSFQHLEESTLEGNCGRSRNALADIGATLASKVGDWALWDDTYEFMVDRNAEYVEANLNPESMETLDLDFMIFVAADGGIVNLTLRGPEFGGKVSEQAVLELLRAEPRVLQHETPKSSHSGLLELGDELVVLASRSIHKSDLTGESRGSLIAGRLFDDDAVQDLASLVRLPLQLERTPQTSDTTRITTSADRITGRAPIADMFGKPLAVLAIEQPRDIHRQGEEALSLLFVALVISSLLALCTTLVGIDRVVLVRLRRLRATMAEITRTGDLSQKAEERGADEITDLSQSFNELTGQLRATQDELLRADRARFQFLANVSHELRTPAAALIGFLDLLDAEDLPADQRQEFVRTVRRNAQHLLTILNDLLDSAKVESGQMTVERMRTELQPLLSDVVELALPDALRKGIDLRLVLDDGLPATIQTDPTRLRQVIANLVGNAVKFTERGFVRLEAGMASPELLRLRIVDSGIGVDEDQQRALFTPFVQADASTSRRFGGTGLGLALSRELARRLGGDVTMTSAPGRGSTFEVTIATGGEQPAAADEATGHATPGPSARPAAALSGRRILVADDARDNGRLLSFVLGKAGASVDVVGDGRAAVEASKREEDAGAPYDLIVMDMQMPVLDGYAATSELRARGFDRPILALTANALKSDREVCIASGCTDYATKPIDHASLVHRVTELLRDDADRDDG